MNRYKYKSKSRSLAREFAHRGARADMFVFYYRCYMMEHNTEWAKKMEGMTVHVIFNDGDKNYNRRTDLAQGFIDLGNGTVRVISGMFVMDTGTAKWENFSTVDTPIADARSHYAAALTTLCWTATVTVERNPNFC
jgi:hypothetical protein